MKYVVGYSKKCECRYPNEVCGRLLKEVLGRCHKFEWKYSRGVGRYTIEASLNRLYSQSHYSTIDTHLEYFSI